MDFESRYGYGLANAIKFRRISAQRPSLKKKPHLIAERVARNSERVQGKQVRGFIKNAKHRRGEKACAERREG
jgi:hypothetical protein